MYKKVFEVVDDFNFDKDYGIHIYPQQAKCLSVLKKGQATTQKEFLDAEQERLGPLYPMYYECDFYNSSSTWYRPEYFQYGNYGEGM
jgi:hypothetical protein